MPYIKQERREKFKDPIRQLGFRIDNVGELNYVFTKLALNFMSNWENSYTIMNSIIGVFESAKLEFYRRWVAPYEDEKKLENGDV